MDCALDTWRRPCRFSVNVVPVAVDLVWCSPCRGVVSGFGLEVYNSIDIETNGKRIAVFS